MKHVSNDDKTRYMKRNTEPEINAQYNSTISSLLNKYMKQTTSQVWRLIIYQISFLPIRSQILFFLPLFAFLATLLLFLLFPRLALLSFLPLVTIHSLR